MGFTHGTAAGYRIIRILSSGGSCPFGLFGLLLFLGFLAGAGLAMGYFGKSGDAVLFLPAVFLLKHLDPLAAGQYIAVSFQGAFYL